MQHIHKATTSTSSGMATVFQERPDARFTETMENIRRNVKECIKSPIFLEAV